VSGCNPGSAASILLTQAFQSPKQVGPRLAMLDAAWQSVTGWRTICAPKLRPVQQMLRVDTAGVQAMAARWGASVGDLDETVAPAGLGLSCQVSAAAVNAAHADVAAFTGELAARVGVRASRVAEVDTCYLVQEAASATQLAAVPAPVIGV
jgi:hypothetical protein